MSADDLGYLCTWGGLGLPLMKWEELDFPGTVESAEACIIDHIQYWVEFQTVHIWVNDVRHGKGMPPVSEDEMYLLHKYVCEKRWARCAAHAEFV